MHDVLAHRLSLLSVHAGALEFHPDAPPAEIAEAAGVIRATAHSALQDLREVIGVLRGDGDGVEPPQPTLDAIPALIEESRAAGMRVQLADRRRRRRRSARPHRLPRRAGGADQRPQARAVRRGGGHRGRRRAACGRGGEPSLGDRRGPRHPAAGAGLIGLAERVALAGGELAHGPNPRGDFVLRATLPWTP